MLSSYNKDCCQLLFRGNSNKLMSAIIRVCHQNVPTFDVDANDVPTLARKLHQIETYEDISAPIICVQEC